MTTMTNTTVAPFSLKAIYNDIASMDGLTFARQCVNSMEYNSKERIDHLCLCRDSINRLYNKLAKKEYEVNNLTLYDIENTLERKAALDAHRFEIEGGKEAYNRVDEIINMMMEQGILVK